MKQISKTNFKVLLVYPNLYGMLVPSIAIAIFTKILKNEGYQVELFETTNYTDEIVASPANRVNNLQARKFSYESDLGLKSKTGTVFSDFRKRVQEYKPDVMFVSAVEDVIVQAADLLQVVDDLNIPHLVGGVFPTAAGKKCFEFSSIKNIALGEGEPIIIEFSERVRKGVPFSDIPGTMCRDNFGKIKVNPKPALVNIDKVTPDFSLYDEQRFYRPMGGKIFKTVPVETYRGCPYSCTFCNSPMQREFSKNSNQGNFLRRKTMLALAEELRQNLTINEAELIYFIDDSFLARPRAEIFEFCKMYEEFMLPFWWQSRVENVDDEILVRLAEVNSFRMSFGIECGNEDYRSKVLRRNISNAKILDQFKIISRSSIPFSVNLIIGMPGETRELIMDTVELVRSVQGYDSLTVSYFTPYHGTVLRTVAIANKWMDGTTITNHTMSGSILEMPPPYVSSQDIDGLMRTLPLYCYFPKSDWKDVERAEIFDDEGNQIYKELSERYRSEFFSDVALPGLEVVGATGCRSNPRDSFRTSPKRLSEEQIVALVG